MPGIDRTTIITGPAIVQYAGSSFWSKGDVVLKQVNKRFTIDTAHFGKVDERFSDRRVEVTFEPAGAFTAALAAVLWPYASTTVGASIYGATDRALVIWGRDGVKVSVNNAAVTQMPAIHLGVDKTMIGAVKFTGLLAKSTDPTAAAAYYTIASATYPGDTGFSVAEILTKQPAAVWTWASFLTETGWDISFNLKLAEQAVDGYGTVDMSLQGIDVSAKAAPIGKTVAEVMTALQGTTALGASLATANDLAISCVAVGSPTVTLTKAALVDAECAWGATKKRVGMCEWIPTQSVTAGTAAALFAIGVVAAG